MPKTPRKSWRRLFRWQMYRSTAPKLQQAKLDTIAQLICGTVAFSYDTPQTPNTSPRTTFPCFSTPVCNCFTLLTKSPTASGPRIVQSMIAHVTTRKLSELLPFDCDAEYIPLLSAIEEIRNPISPRAAMAHPRIEAGYSERGLVLADSICGILGRILESCSGSTAVECAEESGCVIFVALQGGADFLGARPQKCGAIHFTDFSNLAILEGKPGSDGSRRSHRPHAILPIAIRTVYTRPFHTIRPLNISVMGMENPIEA